MPNPKASQPEKTTKASKTPKQDSKIWIVGVLFLIVAAIAASFLARRGDETPPPVVSADEDAGVDAETMVEADSIGELIIESDVRGADVYLNGKRVGKTPHKATPLDPGRYQVKVVKSGYETFEKDVDVTASTHTMSADLTPAADGVAPAVRSESAESSSADVLALDESVAVKHKHRIRGGCEGVLHADAEGIRFETEHKDAFSVAFASVERFKLDETTLHLKIQDGKTYNFDALDDEEEALALFYGRVAEALPPSVE